MERWQLYLRGARYALLLLIGAILAIYRDSVLMPQRAPVAFSIVVVLLFCWWVLYEISCSPEIRALHQLYRLTGEDCFKWLIVVQLFALPLFRLKVRDATIWAPQGPVMDGAHMDLSSSPPLVGEEAERCFRKAMIELADAMTRRGIRCEIAEQTASWLKQEEEIPPKIDGRPITEFRDKS